MEVIFVLLPLALLFSLGAVFAFIWAVRNDQMDDLDTPAMRILFDEEDFSEPNETLKNTAGDSPDKYTEEGANP